MSVENVETVGSFYELLNQGEIDGALQLLPPDAVLDGSRLINPDLKGIHRGRDEIRPLLERFTEAWEELEWVAEDYIEIGDDVIRIGGIRARGIGSGVDVGARGAQLWRFRDGDPVLVEFFQDKNEALEAAGAGESAE